MNTKPIDKSKTVNRKCEHCANWKDSGDKYIMNSCLVNGGYWEYWSKCRHFAWDETKKYKGDT